MKRGLAIMLTAAMLLGCLGCARENSPGSTGETVPPVTTASPAVEEETEGITPEPIKECESAEAFIGNMSYGWNLGLAMSYYAEKKTVSVAGWSALAYITAADGSYSRSDTVGFDAATRTAEVVWKIGTDGILSAGSDAGISRMGIELWNFSLGSADRVAFEVTEFYYLTKDGTKVSCDADKLTRYETDMSGGTGSTDGPLMSPADGVSIGDVAEVRAKIKFSTINVRAAETPESVAEAQTRWGNPLTTQEMINAVRDKGFNLIRVQVSYVTHMDDAGNIDPLWLDRVAEVVDYCMNAGVYCLLTSTGAGWLKAERATFGEQSAIYRRMWEQISARFADYGELLLFEACNEVLNAQGQWTNPSAESYAVMNELYQIFVDTVRAGGGYSATRNLVLNPYAAAYDYSMNVNFKLPEDSAQGHLIAEAHCYEPNNFCFNETNLGHAGFVNEWGSQAERRKLEAIMKMLKRRFVDELGIPVIIGEFGVVDRSSEEEREEYIGYYSKIADQYGIKLVIFGDGGDFKVFDRRTLTWPYEKVIRALLTKGESAEALKEQ